MVAVILSALLIRVSLVCQGFPGFHQGHIGILSHMDEDENEYAEQYVEADVEDDEEGDEDEDGGGPGRIFLRSQVQPRCSSRVGASGKRCEASSAQITHLDPTSSGFINAHSIKCNEIKGFKTYPALSIVQPLVCTNDSNPSLSYPYLILSCAPQ